MRNSPVDKRQAELNYWIELSKELTAGCGTESEKRAALFRVCSEITSPRYLQSLYLSEGAFEGMRVLDLGCGPHGGLINFKGCERFGADHLIDGYMRIGYPLQDHGIAYVCSKAERLPFADSSFDRVICINALDHVDDVTPTIGEIARVTTAGGRFLGQFNFHERPTPTEPQCLSHGALIEICSRNHLRLRRRIFQYRMHDMEEDRYFYEFEKGPHVPDTASLATAESFLLSCVRNGLAHSFEAGKGLWVKPYPEVTGYLLSYFAQDRPQQVIPKTIMRAARRLTAMQHSLGGFTSFVSKNFLFTFDTAQIMHGLASLHLATRDSRWLNAARHAADFVCAMQLPDGSMFPAYDIAKKACYVERKGDWGVAFSAIQAKNIEGLLLMNRLTDNPLYAKAADRLVSFGKRCCDLTYTHPGAYCLEGLLTAGETDFVRHRLGTEILPRVQPNGFLPYAPGLPYAYVSGSVQMAILLFKAGYEDASHTILEWARRVQQQHPGGGLYQYAGPEGTADGHVHSEINSWGTKYFCQLERLWACGQ